MQKIINILWMVACIFLVILLQTNVFNSLYIFGVKCNLILILIVAMGLWYGTFIGGIYGFINGFIADSIYEQSLGKYIILYTALGIIVGYFNNIYKRENKVTLIYLVTISTVILELIEMTEGIVIAKTFPSILTIIRIIGISTVLNGLLASVIYYLVVYLSYKLDEIFLVENRW